MGPTTTTTTHTMPSSTSNTSVTIKMQKPKAMMVGGRRVRRAAPTKRKAASKAKASSSSSPSSPAPLVGFASFLDSFLSPDGGILMEAPATPEDTDSQVHDAPRRRAKTPKQQKTIKNMSNRSSRGKGNISQPRSTG